MGLRFVNHECVQQVKVKTLWQSLTKEVPWTLLVAFSSQCFSAFVWPVCSDSTRSVSTPEFGLDSRIQVFLLPFEACIQIEQKTVALPRSDVRSGWDAQWVGRTSCKRLACLRGGSAVYFHKEHARSPYFQALARASAFSAPDVLRVLAGFDAANIQHPGLA